MFVIHVEGHVNVESKQNLIYKELKKGSLI